MYQIGINEGGHSWEKLNQVTLKGRNGIYDLMMCEGCGIQGKRYSLELITLKGSYSRKKVFSCPSFEPISIGKIRITTFNGFNPAFDNLTTGSEHEIIEPPEGKENDARGVWVMGVGEVGF